MFVDPAVSRAKFDREVVEFRKSSEAYHRRGIWVIDAAFPEIFLVFVAVHPKPFPFVAFGVVLNFENYDVIPPSVRFVNSMTREVLKKSEMTLDFKRAVPIPGAPLNVMEQRPILQGFAEDQPPFLCLQGIREYHSHPGHSGDSWWLYRTSGMGTFANLAEILAKYGSDPIRGLNFQFVPQITGVAIQVPQ